MEMQILSHSAAETQALARRLGAQAFPGAVVALWGDMGAGKTAFVHGLCQGMGLNSQVSSPTFALVHEHDGPIPLYHFDLYRLSDEDELESVGVEEYWYGRGLSAIEWPQQAGGLLPEERLDIKIAITGECMRTFTLKPRGARYERMLEEME